LQINEIRYPGSVATPAEVVQLQKIKTLNRQTGLSPRTGLKGISGAVANHPAPAFPVIIAEWPRNDHEIVRVALDRFNNRYTIDIRSWWRDDRGVFRPGRDGLTLAVKHISALANGLTDALRRAQTFGIIEPTPNSKDRTATERQRRYPQRRKSITA
jgi:hypothetical protein